MNGALLKMIFDKNTNVDLANSQHKKLLYEIAKEMFFDENALGIKNTRDSFFIRLLHSSAIMPSEVSTSFFTKKILFNFVID